MRMSIRRIAGAIGAQMPGEALAATEVTGLSTDTRSLRPGDLFLALSGERFDGHEFVAASLAAGAAAAVVSRVPFGVRPDSLLVVSNTLAALSQIARSWRREFDIPVIAVTGSVGKTSTKELIACALKPLGPVLRTDRNENNEIGLPKTLLRLTEKHRAAVVEMGMRAAGQIQDLTRIAEPTIGVITLIGESHIELLGSRDAIADAKSELFEWLAGSHGVAVFNAGDDYASVLGETAGKRMMTFVDSEAFPDSCADFRLIDARRAANGWGGTASGPGGVVFELQVASPARHDLVNALGAVAVAVAAGVSPEDAARGIDAYRTGPMRMEILSTPSGASILSDCYNAAPTSMRAALDTLAAGKATGRKIAILGDMKELGSHSLQMHEDIARRAWELGLTELYVVGQDFGRVAGNAKRKFETSVDAARFAAQELAPTAGDFVLVKGSRSMAMERIVEALLAAGGGSVS
ncbi:MAG: UDP-N-acetylmuramoyl-tripeptide--D-alanyl-D-alanine ligase [Capsulimonadaceae bacterium]|nr:UDP-N-acetylmuramoyl-tripeptide--D-alanyl-D-alanine ligase [Capsulimonadaceae bacterium]